MTGVPPIIGYVALLKDQVALSFPIPRAFCSLFFVPQTKSKRRERREEEVADYYSSDSPAVHRRFQLSTSSSSFFLRFLAGFVGSFAAGFWLVLFLVLVNGYDDITNSKAKHSS
ncbi:uncharacterized protein LOC131311338 [Rhododendron vialii]|uniref:uncharacterized protein LOC131311338 n=1 Tax=Rhododendron vialii TaxID=182163 RepID=UPI00265F7990|nr:uncharacterized protein LOC131311338 [Rhododendron vialii]